MPTRRWFDHWLSSNRERHLSPKRLMVCYNVLRHANQRRQLAAAHRIVLCHMNLGMSIVAEFAVRHPHRTDMLVSEMFYSLTRSVERIRHGAIDGHDIPNVTGYLRFTLTNDLKKALSKERFGMRPETYRKGKHGRMLPLNGFDFEDKKGDDRDLLEVVWLQVKTEQERAIVSLRLDSHNDKQIGELLELSPARVGQIRNRLYVKVMEHLDDGSTSKYSSGSDEQRS